MLIHITQLVSNHMTIVFHLKIHDISRILHTRMKIVPWLHNSTTEKVSLQVKMRFGLQKILRMIDIPILRYTDGQSGSLMALIPFCKSRFVVNVINPFYYLKCLNHVSSNPPFT